MYVTDAGQTTRFQSIFICVEMAGYIKGVRVDHVGFGEVVEEEDKKKFETRIGDTNVYMRRAYTRIRSIARTAKVLDKQLDEAGLQLEHEKLLLGLRVRVQLPFFHPCPSGGPFYLQRLVGVLSTHYPGFWAHLVRDQVGYNIDLISSLILAIFICRLVQSLRTPGCPHGLLKLL